MSKIEFKKEDLENVAKLSRLKVSEGEADKLLIQMREILNYIGLVSEITKGIHNLNSGSDGYGEQFVNTYNRNMIREDRALTEGNFYKKEILEDAPKSEDGFIVVSQVLAKHKKNNK